jgi:hypothetical protein
MKVFVRMGQKSPSQKSEGIKNGSNSRRNRGIRFGTSVASATFMEKVFSTHRIYFAAFREAHPALTPPVVLIFS